MSRADAMTKLLQQTRKVEGLTRELERARADLRKTVREAREAGETVSEIARRMGVSRARVHQLLKR